MGGPTFCMPTCPYFDVDKIGRLPTLRAFTNAQTNLVANGTSFVKGDKVTLYTTGTQPTRSGVTAVCQTIDTPRRGCQLALNRLAFLVNPAGWVMPAMWAFLSGKVTLLINGSECPKILDSSLLNILACITCDNIVTALGASSAAGTVRSFIGNDCQQNVREFAVGNNDTVELQIEICQAFTAPEDMTLVSGFVGLMGGSDGSDCNLYGQSAPASPVSCDAIAAQPDAVASGAIQVVSR